MLHPSLKVEFDPRDYQSGEYQAMVHPLGQVISQCSTLQSHIFKRTGLKPRPIKPCDMLVLLPPINSFFSPARL